MGLQQGDITLQFDYDLVSNGTSDPAKPVINHSTQTVKLPAGDLAKGTAHKYTFTIGMNEVKVSQSVEDWGEEKDYPYPLYNGKKPNLLAIPGKTAYWVAPEDAAKSTWNDHLDNSCPEGWHVPTKDEFVAMTGIPDDKRYHTDYYDAITKAFPTNNYYWSTTDSGSNAYFFYIDGSESKSIIFANAKTYNCKVRCVRVE